MSASPLKADTLLWTIAALYFLVKGGGAYSLDSFVIGREF